MVLVNLRRLLFLLKVHKLTKLKKQVLTVGSDDLVEKFKTVT